jgi:uncharacterized protein YdeI (YjbR/CyaY-like superfamily)
MPTLDPRVDAYIAKAAPFAQPILQHLRQLVHKACPEVKETIKWSFIAFDYKGPMITMAAFKQHCVFAFWKDKLLEDPKSYLKERSVNGGEAMGNMGKITAVEDVPADSVIIGFIKQAMKLNEQGVKLPKRKVPKDIELEIPDYFLNAIKKNEKAAAAFAKFPPSHKKEYVQWIEEAKTEETRQKRITTSLEWIAEGKGRNWKYEKPKNSPATS